MHDLKPGGHNRLRHAHIPSEHLLGVGPWTAFDHLPAKDCTMARKVSTGWDVFVIPRFAVIEAFAGDVA